MRAISEVSVVPAPSRRLRGGPLRCAFAGELEPGRRVTAVLSASPAFSSRLAVCSGRLELHEGRVRLVLIRGSVDWAHEALSVEEALVEEVLSAVEFDSFDEPDIDVIWAGV